MVPQGGPNTRLNELLDQIRAEFDQEARRSVDYENQSEFVSAVLMDSLPLHMARAVHLRPFFELRLLRAYSIRPQCLKLSPALEKLKKISEAAGKTSPGIYPLLLEQAALL